MTTETMPASETVAVNRPEPVPESVYSTIPSAPASLSTASSAGCAGLTGSATSPTTASATVKLYWAFSNVGKLSLVSSITTVTTTVALHMAASSQLIARTTSSIASAQSAQSLSIEIEVLMSPESNPIENIPSVGLFPTIWYCIATSIVLVADTMPAKTGAVRSSVT